MQHPQTVEKAFHQLTISQMKIERLRRVPVTPDAEKEIRDAIFSCLAAVDLLQALLNAALNAGTVPETS